MKVNVKGHIRDLLAFKGLASKRKKRIAKSAAKPMGIDPMNELAEQLHPKSLHLTVADIRDETKTTKTFKLVADQDAGTKGLAYFRAGQYLSLRVEVDGVSITRPYSISSAPFEALGTDGFYDITIRKEKDGFLTSHMWNTWKVSTKVLSSGPCGFFYHEPLRDSAKIVGLAGGSGITPFRSMAREIVLGDMDAELLIIYGSSDEKDIVFFDEFKKLEQEGAGKFKHVHVLSCEEVSLEGCEQGFITADTIKKHADIDNSSFFICGPQVMYRFVEGELTKFNLPKKRVRREVFGEVKDIGQFDNFPKDAIGKTFEITVNIGGVTTQIPAKAAETVLVAMERANLAPPSECRSGECGFCRSLLVNGAVYVNAEVDRRRAADKKFGYIHPCSSYPITNLELTVSRGV